MAKMLSDAAGPGELDHRMTWCAELSQCTFGASVSAGLRAVGWLERGHPFATNKIDVAVRDQLVALCKSPWQPWVTMGFHECTLCRSKPVAGNANLFIPGNGFLYVAPELIVHYIEVHGYAPPPEFCTAVLACPPMNSAEYLELVRANGGEQLLAPR